MEVLDLSSIPFYSWQKEAIKTIIEDNEPGKYYLIKSFRQLSGKSFTLLNLLGIIAITRPGSVSMLVEPTFSQSQKCLEDMSKAFIDWIKVASRGNCIIDFNNGSRILFKSAEQGNSLRGFTIKKGGILAIDEACYITSEVFELLLPVANKRRAAVVMASTPDRMSGLFYDLWTRGVQNTERKIVSLDWSKYLKEAYTEEELEFYRSLYSKRRFRTEVLGEFDISSGQVFTNLENCILDKLSDSKEYYAGIDWSSGTGNDYTVVTILNSKKEVVLIRAFNDVAPMDQVEYIYKLLKEFPCRKVLVEGNSIGTIFFDALKRKGIAIQKFNTTNESKCRIVDQLVAHFEQEKIKIPYNEELLSQLRGFEEQTTKTGLRTYNCPKPLHDDFVLSLCIALEAVCGNGGTYNFKIY